MDAATAAVLRDLSLWLLLALIFGVLWQAYNRCRLEPLGPQRVEGEVSTGAFNILDAALVLLGVTLIWRGYALLALSKSPVEAALLNLSSLGKAMLGQLLTMGLLLTYLRWRGLPSASELFGWQRLPPRVVLLRALWVLPALPLLLLVQQLVQWWMEGFWPQVQSQEIVRAFANNHDLLFRLAMVLCAVILAPLVEEMLFRGFIYPVLKRFGSAPMALLSSSLLFALIHGHLAVLPALMLFSVLLTLAYERSGCLWVPTLMHAIFNAINIGLMVLFPQS